jgi:hypothetical protein
MQYSILIAILRLSVLCKSNFCGWCLDDFSPDAHFHVKSCEKSLNKESVYGTLNQFNNVHNARRTQEIKNIWRQFIQMKKSKR